MTLRRKTPLRRGNKPLLRSPLRKVSKKHAKELRTYSKLRKEFLATHPICAAGPVIASVKGAPQCQGQSSEVHHMRRRGLNLNVQASWLAVCPICHTWLETHAKTARDLGLILN